MPDNDKVRELHDRLLAQVEALVDSGDWRRFLTVAARFTATELVQAGIRTLRMHAPGPSSAGLDPVARTVMDRKRGGLHEANLGWLRPAPFGA